MAEKKGSSVTGTESSKFVELGQLMHLAIDQVRTGVSARPEFGAALVAAYHGRNDHFNPRPLGAIIFQVGGHMYRYEWFKQPLLDDRSPHRGMERIRMGKYEIEDVEGVSSPGRQIVALELESRFKEGPKGDILEFHEGSAKLELTEGRPIRDTEALAIIPEHFGDLLPQAA